MDKTDMNTTTTYMAQWVTQMRRGWLESCIFNLLVQEELHGYGIMQRLEAIPGLGITEGSLYPLLSRLRLQGLLAVRRTEASPDGPSRKVYGLTTRGKQVLILMNTHFEDMKRQHKIAQKRSVNS